MRRRREPILVRPNCIYACLLLILMSALFADSTCAQAQTDPAAAPALVPRPVLLRASPRVVQPTGGKLPASMSIAVLENCDDPRNFDMSGDYLSVTGVGLFLPPKDQQKATKCAIQAPLTIDPNTPPGAVAILILDKEGKPVAFTDFTVMDGSAAAIPPGLPPNVDVIWGVMSQNNCSDAFGKRVATSMYCIQLKVGNNSGHPLQLAGIGFVKSLKALEALRIPSTTIANASYASTRAVLVTSQAVSIRNLTYESIVAAGLLMVGGTPFFHAANAKANYATASSIVSGPLQQAFNLIFPDPIISQLKNLDDQTFRDNMVIPNNSQIQTVVFVEKQNVTLALNELKIQIAQESMNHETNLVAADKDAQTAQALKDQQATPKGTEANLAATGKAALTAQAVIKQSLTELGARSANTAANSKRPKKLFKPDQDPMLVKLALGSIVIVGDMIEYLQRVQIQNNAGNLPASVTLNPAAPQVHSGDAQAFTATVTGDQNNAGVKWALSGTNCSGDTCGVLSQQTSTTVTYTAPNPRPAPNNTVTLTATSQSDSTKSGTATITVLPPAIKVAVSPKTPAPAIAAGNAAGLAFTATVTNDPTSSGVTWKATGDGCNGATCGTTTVAAGGGITYVPPTVKPSPNTVTLTATSISDATKTDSVTITIN